MVIISVVTAKIIINSSYVLISTTPSARLGTNGMTALPAALAGILSCQRTSDRGLYHNALKCERVIFMQFRRELNIQKAVDFSTAPGYSEPYTKKYGFSADGT